MTEMVEECWTVFAEDIDANYELEVLVIRQSYGGFNVEFKGQHCGKGLGCFWTPWEDYGSEYFIDFTKADRYARDVIEEARYDGNDIMFNGQKSCALTNTRF